FDMSHWQAAKGREIDRLEGIYGQLLDSSGVQVWRGRVVARSATSVEVTDASGAVHALRTRRLVIATGGSPSRDAVPGIDQAMTSTEVLDLDHLPPRVGIIGAGFIALEFAGILRGLGSAVDVFYRGDWPLRGFDGPLRQRLAAALIHQGIR
ncbi:FAD-dependent oxidoreductase, partial [Escherichia coli]|uniref:FAD-dependent oxidoreductase n=1 Tax=Escherichia coli TaxID=562 RepID=UPI003F795841